MTIDLGGLAPSALKASARANEPGRDMHFVELYDDDPSLVESVRTFVSVGLNGGEAAIVVATAAHTAAFEAELVKTADLEGAREQGLYLTVDAEETLASFMDGGRPDPQRFEHVIGGLLRRAGAGGRPVRVFGEMVEVLWAQGNPTAALELENLWNRLSAQYSFRLFCAYSTSVFDDGDFASLGVVAGHHSHIVVPKPAHS